jgi:predicted dehydrogenase
LLHKETPATVEIYRSAIGDRLPSQTREFPVPGWSYREEAKHFLHCVRTGEPFRSSSEDTAEDVALYEEIYSQFLGIKRS